MTLANTVFKPPEFTPCPLLLQACRLLGIGIIGANGAGKSTLFRMLVGQEQPDSGELKIGETVRTMYVDQSREALNADRQVCVQLWPRVQSHTATASCRCQRQLWHSEPCCSSDSDWSNLVIPSLLGSCCSCKAGVAVAWAKDMSS